MPDFIYSGDKVSVDISIALQQLENEVDALINSMTLEATKQVRNGVPKQAAINSLKSTIIQETGFYKAFKNKQRKIINQLESEMVARPAIDYAQENPKKKFNWILEPGAAHCSSCTEASGMKPRTISDWNKTEWKYPRSGKTICNFGCRCALLEESK